MSSKYISADRMIVSMTMANAISVSNTFHPSDFRLCHRTVPDFVADNCCLLFGMDCSNLFILLSNRLVVSFEHSSTLASYLMSGFARPGLGYGYQALGGHF